MAIAITSIHDIIIVITGVLGVIFILRNEQKKSLISFIILILTVLLKYIGI